MNAGLLLDLPHLSDSGADGIGLFRTELQFLIGAKMPRLADQIALYRQVLDAAGGKPVIFRTLDLGGDKIPSYGRVVREENPALGWRAIRIALDRPGLLRYQLRALITAAAGRPLRVMLPMVSEPGEFEAARAVIRKELDRAERVGLAVPKELQLGAMLEVPSLLFALEQILSRADFLSIGSNDLLQFAFASDRTNPKVAKRYDTLAPCVLALLHHIAATAERLGRLKSVSVCGEIAGRPLEAMALLGFGFTSLSMHASMIGPVKMMVRATDTRALRPLMSQLCSSHESSVRPILSEFAKAHEIPTGRT
jgi:phosphotransferase system enzyme I (PtsP)